MLVLSRSKGESLIIQLDGVTWTATVMQPPRNGAVGIRIAQKNDETGESAETDLILERDGVVSLGNEMQMTLVDTREEKVRLGVTGPKLATVHRLEVYEAIRRENDAARKRRGLDDDDNLSSARVPRPKTPPSRPQGRALEEPRSESEA